MTLIDRSLENRKKRICVIGGGVIGLATAYALVRDGHNVILVEAREAVGQEASHANGGQLSYRYVAPLADAGIPLKALGWLCRSHSPLMFRPKFDPAQWRWCLAFLKACRSSINARNSEHLLRLALFSQKILAQWRSEDGLSNFHWRANGKLVLYRSLRSFSQAQERAELSDASSRVLSPAACVEMEPSLVTLTDNLSGGIFSAGDESADCYLFCERLLDGLRRSGRFELVTGRPVTGFDRCVDILGAARLGEEKISADGFVLAAGVRSSELSRPLGIRLPLYPLKGYSLTQHLQNPLAAPETSVTDFDRKVVYARLGDHLRVAAMVDIVGHDDRIDLQRVALLRSQAKAAFPNAGDYAQARVWAGLRPATPTGTPLIGSTPLSNLWLNVGHGALGFTLACGSGQAVSDLICERPSAIALDGLTLA